MSESAPAPFTLYARAGDSFSRVITLTDDDGNAIDLTGASVEWSFVSGANEQQFEDTTEAQVTDAEAGEMTLALTPTQTRALWALSRAWAYEVTVTYAGGRRETVLDGLLGFGREVLV